MTEAPIQKQEGLSEEDKKKMEVVVQKYKEVPSFVISPQKGLANQKEDIKNFFLKLLVDDAKKRASIDSKQEYANNDCIDSFVKNLSEGISALIKGQAWKVTTTVTTVDDFSPAWIGVTTGTGTGTAEAKDVTTE